MRACLFVFGKLKTPGLREAADYYKRISQSWLPLDEIELKPLSVPDKESKTREIIQGKEGKILLERIESQNPHSRIILLDEGGKAKSTLAWAQDFKRWESEGVRSLSFCIGSSLGFSKEVRDRAHGLISFGPQTLPHELCRVVLLEQIFRACSVNRGHPYHNEGS